MPQTAPRTIRFWDRQSETAVAVPESALALDGFREWVRSDTFPKSGQISLLEGEIFVDMSPEEIGTHTQVKRAVYKGWERHLDTFDVADFLPDGPLLIHEGAGLATEPDGLLCLWESLRLGRVVYRAAVDGSERYVEVVGSPDLVLEVVSRSSVHKDNVDLVDLYHRAEIPEYWLIDARADEIRFQILVRKAEGYEPSETDDDGFVYSPVLNRWFRLTRQRNPVGGWLYVLEDR